MGDLLHQPAELEKRKHKLKRLVQSSNSFFMDVKCQGCFNITTVFSHSQSVVMCNGCSAVLSAHGRTSQAYRRVLIQEEERVKHASACPAPCYGRCCRVNFSSAFDE